MDLSRIRARLLALDGDSSDPALSAWARSICGTDRQGIDRQHVPQELHDALLWAGLPLLPQLGEKPEPLPPTSNHQPPSEPPSWPITLDPTALRPEVRGELAILPRAQRLAAASAVDLAPLREWVAQRLRLRLKIAPGVVLIAWRDRAVLLNARAHPAHGFCYGPAHGQRFSIAIPAGDCQVLRWP